MGTLGGTAGRGTFTGIVLAGSIPGLRYDLGEDRPPAFDSAAPTQVAVGNTYTYPPSASDPDGDPLHFTLLSGPTAATFNSTTGAITWATSTSDVGNHAVALRVDDGRGGSAEQDFTISVLSGVPDRPPIFTSTPVVDAYVDTPYTYQATAFDPDSDPLTFSSITAPGGLGITPAPGLVTWTPTADELGPHLVTLQVSDGRGGTATQTYDVLVHPEPGELPPVITSTAPTKAPSAVPYLYQVEAYSPEGYPLTYHLDAGAPTGMTIDATTGLIDWPSPAGLAYTPVTVRVDDDHGGEAVQSFQLVSDIAIFGSGQVTPGSSLDYYTEYSPYDDPNSGTDTTDGNLLLSEAENGTFPYPFQPAPIGSFGTFTPEIDGTYQIDNSIPSGKSGYYRRYFDISGPLITPTITVTANADDQGAVLLNGHLLTDADGDAYAFSEFSNDADVGSTESVYSADAGDFNVGQNELLFVVNNSAGGPTGLSYKAVVTLGSGDIAPVIDSQPPIIAGANRPYEYRVRAHSPTGVALTFGLAAGSPVGMAIDPTTGVITWTPTSGQVGSEAVTVDVTDAYGESATPQAYDVQVQANPADTPPVLLNRPGFAATIGTPFLFRAIGRDDDGYPIRYSLPVAPGGMAIDPVTGVMSWTPTPTEVGPQDLLITLDDGQGGVSTYPFVVTVPALGQAPVITSVPDPAIAGVPYDFPLAANEPGGGPVHFQLEGTIPAGLQVQGGDLTWTSPVYRAGGYPLTLVADDGLGDYSAPLNFTLDVIEDPDALPPTITSEYRTSIQLGRTYLYQVRATDPQDFPLTYSLSGTGSVAGTVTITPGGLVSWTPTALGDDDLRRARLRRPRRSRRARSRCRRDDPGDQPRPGHHVFAPAQCHGRRLLHLRPPGVRPGQRPARLEPGRRAGRHGDRPGHRRPHLDARR